MIKYFVCNRDNAILTIEYSINELQLAPFNALAFIESNNPA